MESKLQDLVDADSVPNEYVEVPEVDLDTIIASTQTVHDLIDKSFKEQQEKRNLDLEGRGTVLPELAALSPKNLFEVVDKEFFNGTTIKSNFLCNLGYAAEGGFYERAPRYDFSDIAEII